MDNDFLSLVPGVSWFFPFRRNSFSAADLSRAPRILVLEVLVLEFTVVSLQLQSALPCPMVSVVVARAFLHAHIRMCVIRRDHACVGTMHCMVHNNTTAAT